MAAEPKLPAPRAIDYTLDDVYLHGRGGAGSLNVGGSIVGADLELTVEGASTLTLTIEDPELALLTSDLLTRWTWGEGDLGADTWVRKGRAVDVRLVDDVWFRLVKIAKSATKLTLTFEDRIVAYLRRHKGAKKASRADSTRAEFILDLVREVRVDAITFYCPELHTRQPIAKATEKTSKADRRAKAKKGLTGDGLTVKGVAAKDGQLSVLERALDVADSLNAPPRAQLALIVAIIQESTARNLSGGDRDSAGVLQVRASTASGIGISNRDLEACVRHFLEHGFWGKGGAVELSRKNPGQPADWIAQQAQGSGHPDAYQPWLDEARKILDAYHGGGGRANGDTFTERFEYARGKDEDSWTAGQRLAGDVNWRLFVRQGNLWYISEEDLFRQRAELHLRERANGVDVLDWDLDMDAVDLVAEVRVTARIENGWTAWPGMVAVVYGQGPADGRYLVATLRRSLLDRSGKVDATLRRPIPEKAEERSSEKTRSADSTKARDLEQAAKHISDQNRAYVYGGGHGRLSDIGPKDGLDCSSSTSLALKRAGFFDGEMALVSGAFARSWGESGKGKSFTVWANDEHVWIEGYDADGNFAWRFDTSPYGTGPRGPHVRRKPRPTAGFTPRHWHGQ